MPSSRFLLSLRSSATLATLAVVTLCPSLARGEAAPVPGVSSGTIIQTFIALAIVVGLLLGTAWFSRKVAGGKGFGQGGMKTLGGITLGPRERIVLVEVGDTWLVIGIVPGQIRTLHTMPKGSAPSFPGEEGTEPPFATWLKQVMDRNLPNKKAGDA